MSLKAKPDRPTQDWFVAQLKPNGFAKARQNLKRQGFATFMPMRKTILRRQSQQKDGLQPLFPGYIFVNFKPGHSQWRVINHTFGVARLITADVNNPQMMPAALMADWLAQCDGQDVLLPPSSLNPGDQVRIKTGPFSDLAAVVEGMTDQGRVGLLLEVLGRATRANFPVDDLEVVAGQ